MKSGTSPDASFSVWLLRRSLSHVICYHGTIIWAGITCKKISCYMHDSACRWTDCLKSSNNS